MRFPRRPTEDQRKRDLANRRAALQRDLERAEADGDDLARAIALNNLGTVAADLEEWPEALDAYRKAVEAVPDDAPLTDRATPHGNAANAARRLDDWPTAIHHALMVDVLATEAEDTEQQAIAQAAVALVRQAVGADAFAGLLASALKELPAAQRKLVRKDLHLNPTHEEPQRPGRNDACWCGSGKKYKHCHMRQDREAGRQG